MKKIIVLSILLILMFQSQLPTNAIIASDVVDQSSTTSTSVTALSNITIFWQSFTPTVNNISQLELYLRNHGVASPPSGIYVDVWINDEANVDTPLATSNITGLSSLEVGQNAWFNASFSITLLQPDTLYYIVLKISYFTAGGWYGIMVDIADPYLGGRASTNPTTDICFKTYYDPDPAALPEIPTNLIPVLIPISVFTIIILKKNKK